MNRKIILCTWTTLVLFTLFAMQASALDCVLPDSFYGALTIDGQPAPAGSEIRGVISGLPKGNYTTTTAGSYGQASGQDKLYVSCGTDEDIINFEIRINNNWYDTGETSQCVCGFPIVNKNIDYDQPLQEDQDNDGYTIAEGDCDDTDDTINPGATETCNGKDDNCNGQTDEGLLTTFYQDNDQDTYGNPTVTQEACTAPQGYTQDNTDCDDTDNTINPGATETCNGKDDNCNGQTDEGLLTTFYQDNDQDTYGNPAVTQEACAVPQGFTQDNTDCDDTDNTINPGATETCNEKDDNCNGQTDEDCTPLIINCTEDSECDLGETCQNNTCTAIEPFCNLYWPIDMHLGWNMVGFPSCTDTEVTQGLWSINDKYREVFALDENHEWKSYNPLAPQEVQTLTTLRPLQGLYIYMNSTGRLIWLNS